MLLKEYNMKRDFQKTAEPAGEVAPRKGAHRFVIQKHAASRLHYDLRLEMDGTLKSWAVPKGVPFAKGEKRLAVEVEDHPVSYINFEGTIPKGEYGGGTVMVWDRGRYEALSEHPSKDLSGGKLHFVLHGEKLEGEWYLVRLRDEKNWLLVRGQFNMKPVSKKMDDTSVVSGLSMDAIAKGKKVWHSSMAEQTQLNCDGVEVGVSNLSKIFYPTTGFTKGEVIDYYIHVARFLLPHLKNRPITLKRYPNGVAGLFFYEKQCPPAAPHG